MIMMWIRRGILAAACLAVVGGCGGPVVPVGQTAKLKPFTSSDNKVWVAADEETFRVFGKSKMEFDEVFERLRDDKKIFRQIQGTRIKVLDRKEIAKDVWVVRGEILTQDHKGQELWIGEKDIEPDAP